MKILPVGGRLVADNVKKPGRGFPTLACNHLLPDVYCVHCGLDQCWVAPANNSTIP